LVDSVENMMMHGLANPKCKALCDVGARGGGGNSNRPEITLILFHLQRFVVFIILPEINKILYYQIHFI
jgi:hypothetical protein